MDIKNKDRREFLKAVGLGSASLAVAACKNQSPSQRGVIKAEIGPDVMTSAPKTTWSTDVLVVGGGPAGIGAALGAARTGIKTLLIENHAFFGGVSSWSLGMPINQMRPTSRPRSDVHELIIQKVSDYGDQAVHIGQHQLWCNIDYLKVALLDALEEVGCRYFVHTQGVDAVVEGNRIVGVVAATKQGLVKIEAKAVVDCTGDADISYFSGAETLKELGSLSPLTLLLKVTNVDMEKAKAVDINELAERAREKYPLIPKSWGLTDHDPSSNSFYINHACTRDFAQFDASNPEELTKAESFARRQALQMVHAMREFSGGALKDMELIGTSPQIGIRESRRVKGIYILTEEDAVNGTKFDDVIAWRSGYLDVGFVRFTDMKIHDVPYRSILPEKVDGLLVAGRCISTTHMAAAAGKSQGNCVATGHAAGLAASLSARNGLVPRELNVSELQDALRADHVDLSRGGEIQKGVSKLG